MCAIYTVYPLDVAFLSLGRIGVEENLFVLTSEMGAVLFFVSKDRFLRLPIYGLGFNLINAFVGFVFSLY